MQQHEAICLRITAVETELSVPRKGSLRVRLDLQNRILSWKESNRWNRNFTRTINRQEIEDIRDAVMACHVLDWPPYYPNQTVYQETTDRSRVWQISIYAEDAEPLGVWSGYDEAPPAFRTWTDLLSDICRQPFAVMD